MKFDVTKLPLGELLVGFILAAVVLTFVLAFAIGPSNGGIEKSAAEGGEAVAAVSPTPQASPPAEGTPSGGGTSSGGTTVDIAMIPTIKFDKTDITVPAGQPVTITADNQDDAIPHNWAIYESRAVAESQGPSAALAVTQICAACTETVTFDPPPPGEYFFRCDVHPTLMVGTFTVE